MTKFPVRTETLLSDDNDLQVKACKKFFESGRWMVLITGEPIFFVDLKSVEFGMGRISAKEYLSDDLSANNKQFGIHDYILRSPVGED